jgi:hypothetical protein
VSSFIARRAPTKSDEAPRRLTRARASGGGDDDANGSRSSSETTISALDALLRSSDEAEEDGPPDGIASRLENTENINTAPNAASRDAKATVSVPFGAVRAALSDNTLDRDASARGDERQSSPIEKYDPEKDPLGLGPQWVVPWGAPTIFFALLAVESGFFFAGALAPAIVYSGTRAADEIPIDNPELFAKDLQAVFDDPSAFSDIIVCAELTQCVLALSVIGAIAASRAPLPPGWFQCSLFGDGVDVDGGFPLEESNAIKQKGGVDAGATEASAAVARKKREAMKRQREKSDDWFGEATRAVFLTWVFVLLVTALAYALGLRGDDQGTASNSVIEKAFAAGPGGAASLVLTTVILAPVLEETVFRGFLLPSLTKYMTVPWAVAASTVVFAVAHEHNTGDTAQLLAVGAMAGISYARTRNLATSIVVHASFNLGVLVLYALWTHS